jgi:hypothetical protein
MYREEAQGFSAWILSLTAIFLIDLNRDLKNQSPKTDFSEKNPEKYALSPPNNCLKKTNLKKNFSILKK